MQKLLNVAVAGSPQQTRHAGQVYEGARSLENVTSEDSPTVESTRPLRYNGRDMTTMVLTRLAGGAPSKKVVLVPLAIFSCLLLIGFSSTWAPISLRGFHRMQSALESAPEQKMSVAEAPESSVHPGGPTPTLFCWSHCEPTTAELPLLRLQLVKRASIFACNFAAVISTEKLLLGNIDGLEVWTWYNPAEKVKMGTNGVGGSTTDSFLNTQTFLFAWKTLMNSNQMRPYDFVVKVDPDAVFFPHRLRDHVREHVGKAVYFSNCAKYGGEVLLYGSLEVFSIPAIKMYQDNAKTCTDLPWHGWGEDYYMQHCMNALGVENIADSDQVGDDRCVAAECWDQTKVAFHDFKDPKAWYDCYETATSV